MPDTWDVMDHWNIVLPPSRPSAWYLSRIVECAQNIDHRAPVAVLGSTPEFRDLLHEQGFDSIYVFDRNVSFYERMCRARIYNNAERFVEGIGSRRCRGVKINSTSCCLISRVGM